MGGQEESFDDFLNPLPAPAVRLWRLGGGALVTKLATAQDPLIKRVCASVLFQALRDHRARLELSADAAGKTLLLRQGLPALVQSTDVVTRNKAEATVVMVFSSCSLGRRMRTPSPLRPQW